MKHMHSKTLHLIEPTLFDQTGHGFSYADSVLSANKSFGLNIYLWCDRRAKNLFSPTLCTTRTYFFRPIRQIQKIFLYRKLIKQPDIIFVSTSDFWDLKILAFYSKVFTPKAAIFLHFHQFKQNHAKLNALRKIAVQCKNIKILTPTENLAKIFSNNGIKNTFVVPCPTFCPEINITKDMAKFSKVLYAGAARSDKGFATVIKLLQSLRAKNINIPFEIQISTPNSQRYDQPTTQALQQLQTISHTNLILHRATLDREQYLRLFQNAICLLLYDQKSYQDKFSGIALDAFYAGCPIITVQNTWMGDTATKYRAGLALANCELSTIQQAIDTIMNNYAFYHANAKQAAIELKTLHDPKNTLACICDQAR